VRQPWSNLPSTLGQQQAESEQHSLNPPTNYEQHPLATPYVAQQTIANQSSLVGRQQTGRLQQTTHSAGSTEHRMLINPIVAHHSGYYSPTVSHVPTNPAGFDTSSMASVQQQCNLPSTAQMQHQAHAGTSTVPPGEPTVDMSYMSVHLPKLRLPTFTGTIVEWPEFWALFRTVHENIPNHCRALPGGY